MEENNQLEPGQLVLCTVRDTVGTTVFVNIDDTNLEGTITFSEIAPGRIRNIRDYVVPNKKIVCKVLNAYGNKIQLSLRRVKPNEKKELVDRFEKEKGYKAILKTVLKEEFEKTIEKISEDYIITDFFEEIKKDPKILSKYLSKENSEKIIKILDSKKEKEKEVKKILRLSSKSSEGIVIIKKIISEACKNSKCNVSYLAAGKYNLSLTGEDFKKLNNEMNSLMDTIEKDAKKNHCEFSVDK